MQDNREPPEPATPAVTADNTPPNADIPPDNGRRASIAKDGSVHGSGAGAGGGNEGEDFDSDPATGDGYLPTGGE